MQAFIETLRFVFLRMSRDILYQEAFFYECLQEFISVYALKVSLFIPLKAFFNECLQGFIGS